MQLVDWLILTAIWAGIVALRDLAWHEYRKRANASQAAENARIRLEAERRAQDAVAQNRAETINQLSQVLTDLNKDNHS